MDAIRVEAPARTARLTTACGWSAVFIPCLCLYAATANRGPQWQDPGYFILRVVRHELVNPLGLALSHPLHHWLGRLAVLPGVLEPCLAVTLVSVLAAAIAVANVYGCVHTLTRHHAAAFLAAGSLALANTFWQMATRAECYTVSAALLAGECWCIIAYARTGRGRALCAAFLLNGLGLANHNLALLTLPVLGVLAWHGLRTRSVHPRQVALATGLWVLGSLPYTWIVVAEWVGSGDVMGTMRSALFGHSFANRVLSAGVSVRLVLLSLGYIAYNFPNLLLPAAGLGIARSTRVGVPPAAKWALAAGLVVHAVFVMRYDVPDQYMFFVPVYVFLSIFGGVGYASLLRSDSVRVLKSAAIASAGLLVLTPVTYYAATKAARHFDALRSVARDKPYRDDYTYVLIPWSLAEDSAERMSRQAVELAGPDGVIIVEDEMARYAVEYQALRCPRPRPRVVGASDLDTVDQAIRDGRPVVLIPMLRGAPATAPPLGRWERRGDLYILDT